MSKPISQAALDFIAAKEQEDSSAKTPAMIVEEKLMKRKKIIEKAGPSEEKNNKPISTRGRRSLKTASITADLLQVPEDEILFQRQYYSIGEVATMFRENQSLIRYWETEFDILQPRKNRKGDRFFRPVDIKNLVLIYDLLRRRKFTIEGAKEYLKKNSKAEEKFAAVESLKKIKAFLLELKANL